MQIFGTYYGVAVKGAGQQRGHGKQVQHVVAVVSRQYRAAIAHMNQIAELVCLPRDDLQIYAVAYNLHGGHRRDGDAFAVGHAAQQIQI